MLRVLRTFSTAMSKHPVVCFDEGSTQLFAEVRQPILGREVGRGLFHNRRPGRDPCPRARDRPAPLDSPVLPAT